MPNPVREGYQTVTPSLTGRNAAAAIEFYGDRFGSVEDPSGHRWGLATHVEDPAPEEMDRWQREFFPSMAKK